MTEQDKILNSVRKVLAFLIEETGISTPKAYALEVSDDLTLRVREGEPLINWPIKWHVRGSNLESLVIEREAYPGRVSISVHYAILDNPIFRVTRRSIIFAKYSGLRSFRGILLADPMAFFDLYYSIKHPKYIPGEYPDLRGSIIILEREKGLLFFKVLFSLKRP